MEIDKKTKSTNSCFKDSLTPMKNSYDQNVNSASTE